MNCIDIWVLHSSKSILNPTTMYEYSRSTQQHDALSIREFLLKLLETTCSSTLDLQVIRSPLIREYHPVDILAIDDALICIQKIFTR